MAQHARQLHYALEAAVFALAAGFAFPAHATDEHFFDSAGVRIRYTFDGPADAPPVLLVHGYSASGDLNWRIPGVIRELEKTFRVITPDVRGHGKSDKPTESSDYGVKMVDDMVRLLDHLQLQRVHMVGYSMGGMITLKLATQHPQRLHSAVIGGMGWMDASKIPPAIAAGSSQPADGEDDSPRARTPAAQARRACARSFPALAFSRQELQQIAVPLIVVIGSDDGLLERRVKPMQGVRADIPVTLIDGANHTTCIFRPEFRQAIREFLDHQPAPAAAADPAAAKSAPATAAPGG